MIVQSEAVHAIGSAPCSSRPGLDRGGVYAITCTAIHSRYIGSSSNLRRRFEDHRKALAAGAHDNAALQRAWELHGRETFRFRVLEYVDDPSRLSGRERAFLNAAVFELGRWFVLNAVLETKQGDWNRRRAPRLGGSRWVEEKQAKAALRRAKRQAAFAAARW